MKMKIWDTGDTRVYKLNSSRCNCYLISKGKTNILVDTSVKREREKLCKSLDELGVQALEAIILTHAHTDHASNAEYFREKYKANVYADNRSFDNLGEGFSKIPSGTNKVTRFFTNMVKNLVIPFQRFEACKVLEDIDSLNLDGLSAEIIRTPGHSDDSISVIINNEIAIVGDAMVHQFKNSIYPPFADDVELLTVSWDKLIRSKCNVFLPAHGSEVDRELLIDCYRKTVDRS